MHLVERIASGIPRMREAMREAHLPEPSFQTEGMFTVTFKRPDRKTERTKEESSLKSSLKIVELMQQQPTVTIAEIAAAIGISERDVKKQIAQLKQQSKVIRIGPDKGGYWQVTDGDT